MFWFNSISLLLTSILFGIIGIYFSLIAKFYRQKFQKGPPYRYIQASLGVMIMGLVLQHPSLSMLPAFLSLILVCLGGLSFTSLCYSLYRTMMSIE